MQKKISNLPNIYLFLFFFVTFVIVNIVLSFKKPNN